jgi:hypothetical protein
MKTEMEAVMPEDLPGFPSADTDELGLKIDYVELQPREKEIIKRAIVEKLSCLNFAWDVNRLARARIAKEMIDLISTHQMTSEQVASFIEGVAFAYSDKETYVEAAPPVEVVQAVTRTLAGLDQFDVVRSGDVVDLKVIAEQVMDVPN